MKEIQMGKVYLGQRERSYLNSIFLRSVVLFGIACCSAACTYRVVDAVTRFRVEGVVQTSEGEPLPNVEIYFVDTGLDQWRRSLGEAISVARTDGKGRVSQGFIYSWGYGSRKNARPDVPGSFYLLFELDGYEFVRHEFNLEDLPRDDKFEALVEFRVALQHESSPETGEE